MHLGIGFIGGLYWRANGKYSDIGTCFQMKTVDIVYHEKIIIVEVVILNGQRAFQDKSRKH